MSAQADPRTGQAPTDGRDAPPSSFQQLKTALEDSFEDKPEPAVAPVLEELRRRLPPR